MRAPNYNGRARARMRVRVDKKFTSQKDLLETALCFRLQLRHIALLSTAFVTAGRNRDVYGLRAQAWLSDGSESHGSLHRVKPLID